MSEHRLAFCGFLCYCCRFFFFFCFVSIGLLLALTEMKKLKESWLLFVVLFYFFILMTENLCHMTYCVLHKHLYFSAPYIFKKHWKEPFFHDEYAVEAQKPQILYQRALEMTHMALVTGTRIVHVIILTYSLSCTSTEDPDCFTSSLKSQFCKHFFSCTDFTNKHSHGCCLTRFQFCYFICMTDCQ